MSKQASTYEEVAKEEGLTGITATRYIAYMKARWANSELVKCRVGYAQEWAQRFLCGIEYGASDTTGQAVLKAIDNS